MLLIDEITEELKKKKITQKKMCQDIGIPEQNFTNWKKGKMPGFESAMKILKYLNISADEMYGIRKKEYTEEEKELIEQYRRLDLKSKEIIKAAINTAAESKSFSSEKNEAG